MKATIKECQQKKYKRKTNLRLEHEVADLTTLPDKEGVPFSGLVLGRLAEDRTVLDGPELSLPGPAGKVFAIEEGLEVLSAGGGSKNRKQ